MNVLIAYASNYGATKEIAERIAYILRREATTVAVKEAESVSGLQSYDAVIMGSGVYFDNWLPEASELLESFQDELASKPVWLFSSGLAVKGEPKEWLFPETLRPLVKKINPKDIALFGGKINASQLGLEDWLVHSSLRVGAGDYRNWPDIEAWATGIAHHLDIESSIVRS